MDEAKQDLWATAQRRGQSAVAGMVARIPSMRRVVVNLGATQFQKIND